jgi:hypothetical protein
MGVAAAAAVGAIAATAGTASWGNAATSLAADDHAVAASQHTPASGSHLELTSRNLAPKPAAPLSASASGHGATAAKPATAPKQAAKAATPVVASDVATRRHAAAAHEAALRHTAAVHHAAAAKQHAAAARAKQAAEPATIYDSVTPGSIPAGKSVATYSDGPFQASTGDVAGRGKVLWIDTDGSNTGADALDVEPGDATPAGAAAWVKAKLAKDPNSDAIVYTFRAAWPKVIAKIGELPQSMQSHVKYWIADPNGTPHIVPGAAATQWYWGKNYDITMAAPGFFTS